MRNIYWLGLLLLVLSCSRGEKIRVEGIVENGTGTIYLDEQGLKAIRKIDSTGIGHDGNFTLKDRITVPTFYNLHLGGNQLIPILLYPGETARVTTELSRFADDYQVEGSESSVHLMVLDKHVKMTRRSLDSLEDIIQQGNMEDEKIQEVLAEYNDVIQKQRRFNIEFVLEHMSSFASIYALYQKMGNDNFILNTNRDIQLIKITSQALDTIYPESEYVQSLKKDAANLEDELIKRRMQRIMENVPASGFPDIRLPDRRGDTIALSSMNGKVFILSFWASWNPASVSLNQDFKRLWDKYHSQGFDIYQVSFDNELANWVNAMNYDELPWINVSELSYPQSSVALLYNIQEIPAYFLVDKEGQIVGRNINRSELDSRISVLLNQ